MMEMFPLNFFEFLCASNNYQAAKRILTDPKDISETIHTYLLKELKKYFVVGGMPEAVNVYTNSESFLESLEVQEEIINSYQLDFSKYKPRVNDRCLNDVLKSSAQSVGQQIKYASLSEDFSFHTIKSAFELLCMAKVIRKIRSCDPSGLPLGASVSDKIF